MSPSFRCLDEEDDYEEEDEQKKTMNRRRDVGDLLRTREKRTKPDNDGERGRRMKRKFLQQGEDMSKRKKLKSKDREEDIVTMGRGKRREILSQQRRKRLAQMLKKGQPSTDEEEQEQESNKSDSSSEEDRPFRRRLNRIDSDDDEEEDENEEEGRLKTIKSLAVERRPENRSESDAQEKGKGHSLSPPSGHWTSRSQVKPGVANSAVPMDSTESGRQARHRSPLHAEEEEDKEDDREKVHVDSLNYVQKSQWS